MHTTRIVTLLALTLSLVGPATADELTEIIQKDLVALGYDPGAINGELVTATVVAISKFQAENGLEVTGEPSPQLAGVIKSKLGGGPGSAAASAPAAAAAPAAAPDPAALAAAQQACLQQKATEAQASNERKRGFARLASAVSRTAARLGGDGFSNDVSELSSGVYDVNAIAGDFKGAAEDLGLTESDIEECRNPL